MIEIVFDWYLAEWLSYLRMSQADLCRATGFPKAKVSELVNGKSRYNRDVVNDISFAMNIYPYELLMHPDEAHRLRRLRETALAIASDESSGSPAKQQEKQRVRKN